MTQATNQNDLVGQLLAGFQKFESQLNGATGSVHSLRKKALESLDLAGLPSTKHEEYKYTNITKAIEKTFSFDTENTSTQIEPQEIEEFLIPGLDAHILVFLNGVLDPSLSRWEAEAGLEITDLPTALKEDSEAISKHFAKYADYNRDAYVALNTGFSKDGSFITVKANSIIEKPVVLHYINVVKDGQVHNHPRNLVVVGENSHATFIESFSNVGEHESLTNSVTEIVIGQSARVDYYKLQNDKENVYHVGTTQVQQAKNSYFAAYTFTTNGAITRNNLNIDLEDEGCESHMYGLYLLNGKTHVDNHTAVDHQKPNSFSNELYKGILEDKSRGVFNGKIFVRQDAQKTNAFQSNKNILLSDQATVNTKPQLEIWADDVKCSHGCTTGQLDEEALFYLQSRGLGKDNARALLLYAFAIEVLENVKLEPVRKYLEDLISERLRKDF